MFAAYFVNSENQFGYLPVDLKYLYYRALKKYFLCKIMKNDRDRSDSTKFCVAFGGNFIPMSYITSLP